MRPFAKVGSTLWSSKKFKKLSDRDKLVYLYILTSRHASSVGCYVLHMAYMGVDTGFDQSALVEALQALEAASLIQREPDEELIYIQGWMEFYMPASPNHCKKMIYDICPLPECDLKYAVARDLMDAMTDKGWTTEIDLLKTCLRPSEGLAKTWGSTDAPYLTKPHLTKPLQESEVNGKNNGTRHSSYAEGVPVADNVSRETSKTRLFEAFPQIQTADDFANRLPDRWKAVYADKFGDDPDWEKQVWGMAHDFWTKYVGKYPGDLASDGFPDKSNWLMCWDHAVDAAWRTYKQLPPKVVKGTGFTEGLQRTLGVKK